MWLTIKEYCKECNQELYIEKFCINSLCNKYDKGQHKIKKSFDKFAREVDVSAVLKKAVKEIQK